MTDWADYLLKLNLIGPTHGRAQVCFTVFADNRQLFGAIFSIPHILQMPFTSVFGPVTMPFSPLMGT